MSSMPEIALITGACGDIGRALVSEMASAGVKRFGLCDLAASEQAEKHFAELRRHGAEILYRQADVSDADAVNRFVGETAAAYGGIDLCIGNAGIVVRGSLLGLPVDAWRRTLDVNLTGCFLTAQAAARVMRDTGRGGHIVLLSSWTQDVPRQNIGAYCVSKAALKMLAKCLALELGQHEIRVNLVAPGYVDAGLTGQNLKENPDRRSGMEASIPLGRLISAAELARTVRLFCSGDAAYMTGATLLIDGGSSLHFEKTI